MPGVHTVNIPILMKLAGSRVQRESRPVARVDATLSTERELADTMNTLLVAVFSLYVKSRNFQWHVRGSQFLDSHLLLEEQGDQLYFMLRPIVLQLRTLGRTMLGPISSLPSRRVVAEDEVDRACAGHMLLELRDDNRALMPLLRRALVEYEDRGDDSSRTLIEEWLDQAAQRANALWETQHSPLRRWR